MTTFFDILGTSTPYISTKQFIEQHAIPIKNITGLGKKGVYFLKQEGRIVYVGQSRDCVISRISHHLSDKTFDSYIYLDCTGCSDDDLNQLEAKYIFEYAPPYNIKMPENDTYKSLRGISETLNISLANLKQLIKQHNIKGNNSYYNINDIIDTKE